MTADLARQRRLEETEASIRIQRTFRGLVGRQMAKRARDSRNRRIAVEFLVTRQVT